MTSLYKINQIIKDKTEVSEEEQTKLRPVIPEYYHDYLNMFSKEASNILPPARPYDYKIKLMTESSTRYCLLYKMSLKELEAAKQYIQENLDKGFIIPSQAPFTLLILMVRKHDGALCLCINY
jgi:hypothetical protein